MSIVSEAAPTLWPASGDRHGPLSPLLVALTCVTGLVDAASYLKLGHVFVANMTGNVVFLGFALAGASGLSGVASLVALAAFLLGALAGGGLGAHAAEHRGHVLRAANAAEASAMALALVIALSAHDPLHGAGRYALVALLALAMGIQNAAAQRLSVPDLTTTVLTRTLTGLASEARLVGGAGANMGRRVVAVTAMLAGALVGGLLVLHVSVAAAVGAALVAVVAVAGVLQLAADSDAEWTRP